MLSKAHRFHGLRALNFVYKTGRIVRGPVFGVRAVHNPKRNSHRVAVVISKKVHKSAVARNRMRRRIYGAIREITIPGPYDIVITVFNEDLLDIANKDLRAQLKRQLKDAGVTAAKR